MIPAIIVGLFMLSIYAFIGFIQRKFGSNNDNEEYTNENDEENNSEILNNLISKIEDEKKEEN